MGSGKEDEVPNSCVLGWYAAASDCLMLMVMVPSWEVMAWGKFGGLWGLLGLLGFFEGSFGAAWDAAVVLVPPPTLICLNLSV